MRNRPEQQSDHHIDGGPGDRDPQFLPGRRALFDPGYPANRIQRDVQHRDAVMLGNHAVAEFVQDDAEKDRQYIEDTQAACTMRSGQTDPEQEQQKRKMQPDRDAGDSRDPKC